MKYNYLTLNLIDFIVIFIFVVNIIFIFLVILYFIKNRRKKRIRLDIYNINRNSFYINCMIDNIVNSLLSFRAAMEVQNTLISRIIRGQTFEDRQIKKIQNSFLEDEFAINKYLQSLIMYTDNNERKRSALKQLSEKFGDVYTINSLKELLKFEKDKRDINKAILTLSKRINDNLKYNLL